jgi:hypothetical protein
VGEPRPEVTLRLKDLPPSPRQYYQH